MEKKERLEEEFEFEDESQAFEEYSHIASLLSVNYCLMVDELSQFSDFNKGLALDVGTGLGDLAIEVAKRYPALKVIGIDISRKAIESATNKAGAQSLNNVTFQLADAHNLPFEDNSFDLVVSHGSIHHLKNPTRVFLEIYRILKPNALAYLSDLRRDAPEELVKEVEGNLPKNQATAFLNSVNASYTLEELKKILEDCAVADFEVSNQKFSRETILKNKEKLRASSMRNASYNKLSVVILIRKKL